MFHQVDYIMCNGGDWEAVYVDGEKYAEGHSTPTWVWLQIINELGFKTTDIYDEDAKLGPELDVFGGRFPQTLAEVEAYLNGS